MRRAPGLVAAAPRAGAARTNERAVHDHGAPREMGAPSAIAPSARASICAKIRIEILTRREQISKIRQERICLVKRREDTARGRAMREGRRNKRRDDRVRENKCAQILQARGQRSAISEARNEKAQL
eukprot:5048538-Pyramimonas_sp.AAC.1